jgi:hypothetical protein
MEKFTAHIHCRVKKTIETPNTDEERYQSGSKTDEERFEEYRDKSIQYLKAGDYESAELNAKSAFDIKADKEGWDKNYFPMLMACVYNESGLKSKEVEWLRKAAVAGNEEARQKTICYPRCGGWCRYGIKPSYGCDGCYCPETRSHWERMEEYSD